MEPDLDLKPEKAFDQALRHLYPVASGRQLVTLFDNRAAHSTIVNWRAGRRNIPRWAIDLVRREWYARSAAIAYALDQIKERPGLKAGALNLAKWRARQKP
jgi:hypothetical protein